VSSEKAPANRKVPFSMEQYNFWHESFDPFPGLLAEVRKMNSFFDGSGNFASSAFFYKKVKIKRVRKLLMRGLI
jgi:hypothetical protein